MTAENRMTLQDWVRDFYVFDCNKHGLAPDCVEYADQKINEMTNAELVDAISDAFEQMIKHNTGG